MREPLSNGLPSPPLLSLRHAPDFDDEAEVCAAAPAAAASARQGARSERKGSLDGVQD